MNLDHGIRLAIADDFFSSHNQLPRKIQNKVSEFINRFRQSPTRSGLNYESIKGSRDKRLKSVRVDLDYRAIVLKPETGNTYLLLWVDQHDDAYQWARRKVCQINQVSGSVQIIDVEQVEATTEKLKQSHQQPEAQPKRFDAIADRDLMRLGVPEILLPAVREIVSDRDVEELLPHLPKEASDGIFMLAAGYPLPDIFQQLERPEPKDNIDPDNLEAALDNEDSRSRFMVVTDDTELEEMLAAPLEKWRVFLHPTQRKLVERDWNGAVRVLGGAGTGKTVVAMHRAKWLAENRLTKTSDRLLFTTFTRNLAIDIENNLKTICTPEVMKRIRVINLDSWVTSFLKEEGIENRIVYNNETDDLWQQAYTLAPPELGFPLSFYREEWQEVLQQNRCQTLRDYLGSRRIGRGTRLSRQQRQGIWLVFEEYRNLLREAGYREANDAMYDAISIIRAKGREILPYKAVIVDEAQDMSKGAFELIRAIAGPPTANDIFLVGDAHQRIYGQTVILSHCHIDIRGRSKKLRLNYRTTDETRKWATAVLENLAIDDLDGGVDSLQDYRSIMHGDAPIVKGFKTFEQEISYLQELLTTLQNQGNTGDRNSSRVCMVFRTQSLMEQYESALGNYPIKMQRIKRNQPDNLLDEGIRIGTMHRVKGLQFDWIVLPGLNDDILPLKTGLNDCPDDVSKDRFITAERCLLHVAATRAKQQVLISYYGKPSPFVSKK